MLRPQERKPFEPTLLFFPEALLSIHLAQPSEGILDVRSHVHLRMMLPRAAFTAR